MVIFTKNIITKIHPLDRPFSSNPLLDHDRAQPRMIDENFS